jgi:hypothetical protein
LSGGGSYWNGGGFGEVFHGMVSGLLCVVCGAAEATGREKWIIRWTELWLPYRADILFFILVAGLS